MSVPNELKFLFVIRRLPLSPPSSTTTSSSSSSASSSLSAGSLSNTTEGRAAWWTFLCLTSWSRWAKDWRQVVHLKALAGDALVHSPPTPIGAAAAGESAQSTSEPEANF